LLIDCHYIIDSETNTIHLYYEDRYPARPGWSFVRGFCPGLL